MRATLLAPALAACLLVLTPNLAGHDPGEVPPKINSLVTSLRLIATEITNDSYLLLLENRSDKPLRRLEWRMTHEEEERRGVFTAAAEALVAPGALFEVVVPQPAPGEHGHDDVPLTEEEAEAHRPRIDLLAVVFATGPTAGDPSQPREGTTGAALQDVPPEVLAYADTVLYGGKVLTVDGRFSIAEAVAIRGDRILAVGETERLLKMAGPRTVRIDLRGRTVVPGLIDTHHHLGDYSLRYMLIDGAGIAWEGKPQGLGIVWRDAEMALRDIRRAVEKAAPGETLSFPLRNEEAILSGLTMARLDAISPDHPVLLLSAAQLRTIGANSKAIRDAEIPAGTPGLPSDGGVRVRDKATEYLKFTVTPEAQILWQEKTMKLMNSWGLTLVTTRITPEQFNAVRELWLHDRLTIRWRIAFPGPVNFQQTGNVSDIGDDWLRISGAPGGAMPGSADTLGHWTSQRPLAPAEGASDEEGAVADPAESWRRRRAQLVEAFRYGWSVPNTHIKGDIAVREFLNAVEAARANPAAVSSNQRITMDHMIEVDDADIQRMKKLGVIPSNMMRSIFSDTYSYEGSSHYEKVFGADYVNGMLPLKKYLALGMTPTIEADSGDERGRPMWTIEKAVCRCVDGASRVWAADQRVSREDALRMKTIWSATYTGDEKELGSLEPGKLADLLVLDGDYLTVPEQEISELKVLLTIVGGKTAFMADSLDVSP